MEGASEIFLMQPPPPGRDSGKHSDLTSSLFSIRALYARYLSIQALVLALFLTFVGVNSYVLSHGVRKSTLICISFLFTDSVQPCNIRRILSSIVRCYACTALLSHQHCSYAPSVYYDCGSESVSALDPLRSSTKAESGSAGGC